MEKSLEQVRAALLAAEKRGDEHEAANLRLELRYLADLASKGEEAKR